VYQLMIYDVDVKRVTKVLKIGRKYLNHIQNSVLKATSVLPNTNI